jgi:hypothetical protein
MNRKIFICILLTAFLTLATAFSIVSANTEDNSAPGTDQPNLGDIPTLTDQNPLLFRTRDNSPPIADDNSTLIARAEDNVTVPARDSSLVSAQSKAANSNPLVTTQLHSDYNAIIVFVAAVLGTVIGSTILAIAKFRKSEPR